MRKNFDFQHIRERILGVIDSLKALAVRHSRGISPIPASGAIGEKNRMPISLGKIDWEKIYRKSFLYNSLATVICAYFVADLLSVAILPWLPAPEAPRPRLSLMAPQKGIGNYENIFASNAFNDLVKRLNADDMKAGYDGPPVRTSLPLTLLGVIVVSDDLKSVASVEDKSANQVVAVRVNDTISPGARVQKIESGRLIFINENTERREYIELPKENITASIRPSSSAKSGSGGIQNSGNNRFSISRDEVDKTLANLNEVLTQARCVPNFEGGRAGGFRCFQIVPGSIYDKLGMKDNDVIMAINGEALNDPSKAFTLLTTLKNSDTRNIELTVSRNGRVTNLNYDIN